MCVGKGVLEGPGAVDNVQEFNDDSVGAQDPQLGQTAVDAAVAGQLQQQERHGAADRSPAPGHGSLNSEAAP